MTFLFVLPGVLAVAALISLVWALEELDEAGYPEPSCYRTTRHVRTICRPYDWERTR